MDSPYRTFYFDKVWQYIDTYQVKIPEVQKFIDSNQRKCKCHCVGACLPESCKCLIGDKITYKYSKTGGALQIRNQEKLSKGIVRECSSKC
jgi:hypothetical protein